MDKKSPIKRVIPERFGSHDVLVNASPKATRVERMTRRESDALITLAAISRVAEDDLTDLNTRAAWVPGMKRDLALMRTLLKKLVHAAKSTVPDSQLQTINSNCAVSEVWVGVKTINRAKRIEQDFGQVISYEDLNCLVDNARQQCMLCTRDKCSENKCPLKITFDRIGMNIEHKGECGYKYEWNVPMESYR